jgi:hypothetical protein
MTPTGKAAAHGTRASFGTVQAQRDEHVTRAVYDLRRHLLHHLVMIFFQ